MKLTDAEKATLYVYLHSHGLPPWSQGENQAKALAALAGWTDGRAEKAMELAYKGGLLDDDPAPPVKKKARK